jgi:hypothetical protein
MLNVAPEFEQRAADDAAVEQVMQAGGRGALALVAVATSVVAAVWLAFYACVFLPRTLP